MRRSTLLLSIALLGCGAPAAKSPSTSRDVDVKPVASGAATAASSRRVASKELQKAWPLERPNVVVYADVDGLFKTKLIGGLVTSVMLLAGSHIPPAQRKCVDAALDSGREIAFGMEDKSALGLFRFDPAAQKTMAACVASLVDADKATTIDGAAQAWTSGKDEIVAAAPGLLVVGPKTLVARALGGRSSGASLAGLGLAADEYVTFTVSLPEEGVTSRGTLLASDQRFRIAVDAEVPSEAIAKKIEEGVGAGMIKSQIAALGPAKAEEAKLMARLAQAVSVERDGKRVKIAFDLQEPVDQQAQDLGAFAALSIFAVRKYIANAKQAEARNTLGVIAKDMAVSWEREDGTPFAKKRLVSLPAVPKAVPRGTKVQTTAADWRAWDALRFSMDSPQYYQYEVKAAKDGESAEILARGDLNGDGKTSLFKLVVKVKRPDNMLMVAPTIDEKDPDE